MCVRGAPQIGPFGPGYRYVSIVRKKIFLKEKSPTRRSGAAETSIFCVGVLLATGYTWRVCDFADPLHAKIYITHKGTGNNQKSMSWDL